MNLTSYAEFKAPLEIFFISIVIGFGAEVMSRPFVPLYKAQFIFTATCDNTLRNAGGPQPQDGAAFVARMRSENAAAKNEIYVISCGRLEFLSY